MKTTFIYVLETAGSPYYVGKAGNTKTRYRGQKAKDLVVLAEVPEVDEGFWEKFWIGIFRSGGSLKNLNNGGGGPSHHTNATRAKISAAQKGRKHSPETREKISVTQKGKKFSPEHCAKISVARKGKVSWNKGKMYSPETREKISAALRGKKQSAETIAKRVAATAATKQRKRLQKEILI